MMQGKGCFPLRSSQPSQHRAGLRTGSSSWPRGNGCWPGPTAVFPTRFAAFNLTSRGAGLGQHRGSIALLSRAQPACKKTPSSHSGLVLPALPIPGGKTHWQEPKDDPCGDACGRSQVGTTMSPCSLGAELAVGHGMAGQGWESPQFFGSPQLIPKRDGSQMGCMEGVVVPPLCSPLQHPPGQGRGEQPNAFQKISCKWPGRVIHIKLIKPLLASQGRNPDVAVYLFWI